jgi:hypothetical protein
VAQRLPHPRADARGEAEISAVIISTVLHRSIAAAPEGARVSVGRRTSGLRSTAATRHTSVSCRRQ